MKNTKFLLLTVTSNTYPAVRNTSAQKKIYLKNKNFDIFPIWYKGIVNDSNELFKFVEKENELIINTSDSSRNMGYKSILAFQWALENFDFQYLIRPNPSSYLNFQYFNNFLENLFNSKKNKYLYAGNVMETFISDFKKIHFVSGSTIIFNKKCVELIIKNKETLDNDLWDDVSFGELLSKHQVYPVNIDKFDIKGNIFKQEISDNYFQYRYRADNFYNYPRFIEASLVKILDAIINKKKVSNLKKTLYYIYFEIARLLYVKDFTWKIYIFFRKLLKKFLSEKIYKKIKYLTSNLVTNFKHKRFKY